MNILLWPGHCALTVQMYSMVCSTVYTQHWHLEWVWIFFVGRAMDFKWVNLGWIFEAQMWIFRFCQWCTCSTINALGNYIVYEYIIADGSFAKTDMPIYSNCLTEFENNLLIYYVDYGHNLKFNIAVWSMDTICNFVSWKYGQSLYYFQFSRDSFPEITECRQTVTNRCRCITQMIFWIITWPMRYWWK